MSDWRHSDSSDEWEEFELVSTHLFRWLFIATDLADHPHAWEPVARKLLTDPREYLDLTRKAWDDYNRDRGDCFGNFRTLEILRLDPLTVCIHCTAYYANGFPCEFNATFTRGILTDILVGH